MRLLAVDYYNPRDAHLHFNATAIAALLSSPVVSWLGFCGEKHHLTAVGRILDGIVDPKFVPFPIEMCQRVNHIGTVYQILKAYCQALRVIRRERPDHIIFLAVESTIWPLSMLAFNLVYGHRHNTILSVVLHNNLIPINNNPVRRSIWNMMFRWVDMRCIVLADSVQEKFRDVFPNESSFLLRHPSFEFVIADILDSIEVPKTYHRDKLISLFIAGRHAEIALASGFLAQLLSECKKVTAITGRKFEITVSTNLSTPHRFSLDSQVVWMNRRLSRQEYFQAIAHADYVVFPRGNETAYRASAVLIDAITLETPVLAPDEGHFREMVSRDGLMKGGWLYNHQDDLSATMLSLAKTSPSEYASMCRHVASIKQEISIENASMSLQSILGV